MTSKGMNSSDFPNVYLLTSVRFLNRTFIPASFWYLYSPDLTLEYVIAEVNNTFKERRMYLFRAPQSTGVFKQECSKDFHVSPFNSRKGSYSLSTTNPAKGDRVGVVVTLRSSKGHPKLVTRLWSDTDAIDASSCSFLCSIYVLICWGYTVLLTCKLILSKHMCHISANLAPLAVSRIVFQATLLAQWHKLGIWYRPEPSEPAIPRKFHTSEIFIAHTITKYLRHLLNLSSQDVKLRFHPGLLQQHSDPSLYIRKETPLAQKSEQREIELRVQTPHFYRQLITYGKFTEFLTYALLEPYSENHTACSDDPVHLIKMLDKCETIEMKLAKKHEPENMLATVSWGVYRFLRSSHGLRGVYPYPGLPKKRNESVSHPPPSRPDRFFLDEFVCTHFSFFRQLHYMFVVLSLQMRQSVVGMIGGE